ncbi:MAG: IscS subfamily cysteine desulfurase [Holosporaceae bacterium]|nr:IscS subfamily cysteine desulfurase [Holosporaceae bacterium]
MDDSNCMANDTVYMDYQATTPCDRRVLERMLPYFCDDYGNPHSQHSLGVTANDAVENAREQIASLIGVRDRREIVFTSGATESNNLAIQGIARFYREKGNRIITTTIEHKCVLEAFGALSREGFDVVFVPVLSDGRIDLNAFRSSINDRAIFASVMWVNNEIGVCQPIEEIGKICRSHGVIFHSDAAQAVGKIEVDASHVDLMSISGHKIYGPKGVGALYVTMQPRIRLSPLLWGGGQERGMRSGTLATPLCVGLGAACEIAALEMAIEYERLVRLRKCFLEKVFDALPMVQLNGSSEHCIPGCINLSFEGIEGESIMMGMPEVCVSSGSACTSKSLEPSYVLRAINVKEDLSHSSIRFGIGRFTTMDDVEYAVEKLIKVVERLRSMSPLW